MERHTPKTGSVVLAAGIGLAFALAGSHARADAPSAGLASHPTPLAPAQPLPLPALTLTLGAEMTSTAEWLNPPSGVYPRVANGAVSVQLAADLLRQPAVLGVFFNLGAGPCSFIYTGVRGGYRFRGSNVNLLAEVGLHHISDVGESFLTSSDIPGADLPFVGARVEWTPRQHHVFSPIFAVVVRDDLTTVQRSGTFHPFLGEPESRTYQLGGISLGVQMGVSFDFDELR
jgi:hypothetical protein